MGMRNKNFRINVTSMVGEGIGVGKGCTRAAFVFLMFFFFPAGI